MSEGFPENLRYNKDYLWVQIDKDVATVGVVGPAAKNVKEFVFIKLPEKGKKTKKGETYVSLEAVKWSGHLSSPVSGDIVDVNESLFNEPSKINTDPYKSWIMKVRLSDLNELNDLVSAEDAKKMYD